MKISSSNQSQFHQRDWGLDLEVVWKHNMKGFAESFSPLLSKTMSLSMAEYMERWCEFLEESKDPKPFTNTYAAWIRKFLNSTNHVD